MGGHTGSKLTFELYNLCSMTKHGTKFRIGSSQIGCCFVKFAVPHLDVKLVVPSPSISRWTLNTSWCISWRVREIYHRQSEQTPNSRPNLNQSKIKPGHPIRERLVSNTLPKQAIMSEQYGSLRKYMTSYSNQRWSTKYYTEWTSCCVYHTMVGLSATTPSPQPGYLVRKVCGYGYPAGWKTKPVKGRRSSLWAKGHPYLVPNCVCGCPPAVGLLFIWRFVAFGVRSGQIRSVTCYRYHVNLY